MGRPKKDVEPPKAAGAADCTTSQELYMIFKNCGYDRNRI